MKKKILIIEDILDVSMMLNARLEANGYEVILADSGEEGLEKVKSDNPDLIILDLMLPGINGFEVCTKLKVSDDPIDTPIIILSSKFSAQDKFKAARCGADSYIPKPYSSDLLIDEIRKHIG